MNTCKKLIAIVLLIAFTSISQCWAGPEGFVVDVTEYVGGGRYSPKVGEDIWGLGVDRDYMRYHTGGKGATLFGMYPGAQDIPYNQWASSRNAFFRAGGYDYFNNYFITPPEGRLFPVNQIGNGGAGYYPNDTIRIPPKTTITAHRMNQPVAGLNFRLISNFVFPNGTPYQNMSPRFVTTNAQGKAEFRAPTHEYRAASVDENTADVFLWEQPVNDYVNIALCDAAGNIIDIDYDTPVRVGSGGKWTIYAEDRPEVIGLFSEAYDGRNNHIVAEWEDLSSIPDHYAYEMLIMDPQTGTVLGSAVTQDPYQSWILPVNTNLSFAIIAYDKNLKAYCNSYVFTFNTGPAKWTGFSTRSLAEEKESVQMEKSEEKKIKSSAILSEKKELNIENFGEKFNISDIMNKE